jgi:hypothetical protein
VVKLFLALLATALLPFAARADSLPSREPGVVLPVLQAWHEHESFARIEQILGKPDMDIGSAFSIAIFRLSDGTSIYVKSTPSRNRIYSISRSKPGGLAETLYEPRDGDLDHPVPGSAPF